MTTAAVTPQIQGLPPGAVVTPLTGGGTAPSAGQVQGLPPGATVTPIGGQNMEASSPAPADTSKDSVGGFLDDYYTGVAKGAVKSLAGIDSMVSKIPVIGKALTPHLADEQAYADKPDENVVQSSGGFMESAMEFLMGDEALKSLSLADKLKKVAPILKQVETSPRLAQALEAAMRTGTVSGAQTLVKTGGDVGEAAKSAAVGGITGGVVQGAAGKLVDEIAARSPQVSNVAGEEIVTPRAPKVPDNVQKNQAAGQNVIAKSAQAASDSNTVKPGLYSPEERQAAVRRFDKVPPAEIDAASRMSGDELNRNAETWIGRQQDAMRRGASISDPDYEEATQRASMYHGLEQRAARSGVISNVPAAISKAQSFGDAADEVEKSAKDAYGKLNQATGGQFTGVRDEVKAARKAVWNAGSPDQWGQAQEQLETANAKMQKLFDDSEGKITPQDWKDANSAWTNAKTLDAVHRAVESTFDTDAGFSQRSGTYRGFNGNQLRQNLNRLTQKIGDPELNRVVGRDNMDNLRKIAELTRTNADRAKFGAAVQQVAHWFARDSAAAGIGAAAGHFAGIGGVGGAVAGEAAYMAARKVMQVVATNPRVGQQLTFAVESGARPEYFAPLIGKMIRDADQQQY